MDIKLIVAPISSKFKKDGPCSKTDFNEQMKRNTPILNGDMFWCWDDAPENIAVVGDIFAFWQHDGEYREGTKCVWVGGRFIFHKIEEVQSPSERLPSWSDNVGQTHRNVLKLSPPIITLTFDEVKKFGMKPNYFGTKYAKSGFEVDSPLRRLILLKLMLNSRADV